MLKDRTLTMSIKEIKRCEILKMADEKQITQSEGAKRICVTERHFRRLLYSYRESGAEGIISRHRGMISNNRLSKEKEEKIIGKLKQDYQGFGPTLASEKLLERDGIKVSKETVRQIMIMSGMHKPKTCKKDKARPLRQRRPRRGELVQIDGSYHAWLEDRAEKPVCSCLSMMQPVKSWPLNLWIMRVSGLMLPYASIISANMGFQKPSTRIASAFSGSIRPM